MGLLERSDGRRVRGLTLLRRFMPFLMRSRNESVVYFEQQLRVDGTLAWLAGHDGKDRQKFSFFHVVLAAVARILGERPKMHRFVVGRRLHDRKKIELSFAVKKTLTDDAALSTVKVGFDPEAPLDDVPARVDAAIREGRGSEETVSEKEMKVVALLPRFLLRLVMWAQQVLDYWGLLPTSMISNDPLYASAFLANLGSVGLDAPFHHLYEYGTVSIFIGIGKIQDAPVVTDGVLGVGKVVTIRYSFDERVADGYYAARSLDRVQQYIEDPALMERPYQKPSSVDDEEVQRERGESLG